MPPPSTPRAPRATPTTRRCNITGPCSPEKLNAFNLAYLHVMRADFFGVQKADVLTPSRDKYKGVLIGNMG